MMKLQSSCYELMTCQKPNSEAHLRLFCFPFAGGGAWVFNSWGNELPLDVQQEIELWSLDLPGHRTSQSELLFTRLSPLVDLLGQMLKPHLNIPFVFFGHSMGALVIFELARQLRNQSFPGPIHMVVSGHRAPQLPDRQPALHKLPDRELLTKLRKLGGTPEGVLQNSELMELLLPILRADFAICENYLYTDQKPLDCSITAFGGNADKRVGPKELAAWHMQTFKCFRLRMFPGNHFFLQDVRTLVLQVLAEELRQVLRRYS